MKIPPSKEELESISQEPIIVSKTEEVQPIQPNLKVELPTSLAKQEPPTILSSHPLEQFLKECPEHGDKWSINKFKKHFHKMPDGSFCNFSNAIKPIAAEIVKSAGYDGETFKTFLKDNYRKPWSQINEVEQIAILILLDRKKEKNN